MTTTIGLRVALLSTVHGVQYSRWENSYYFYIQVFRYDGYLHIVPRYEEIIVTFKNCTVLWLIFKLMLHFC